MTLRSVRAPLVSLVAAMLLVGGCGDDGFEPGVPTHVSIYETGFTFTAIGQNHLFPATASDAHGHPLRGALIWSSSDPSVIKVNGDGLATAVGPGVATVTATAGAHAATVGATVHQLPAHIVAAQGNGQGGIASQALPAPFVARVTDALNRPVGGVLVTFTTTDPGASVAPDTATTDLFGFAATTLTLGPATGTYQVTATVTGTVFSTSFSARTSGPFAIDLLFVSSQPTPSQAQAFALARSRWESIITADLPDDYAFLAPGDCGNNPAIDQPIDDLLIFVSLENIDGPGGVLGQAGPCFLHSVGFLPAIGQMTFDVSDLDVIEAQGLLPDVVLHEMGHVLGYGTLWSGLGLLADPAQLGGFDPHFTGPLAVAAFDSLGGAAYAGGKVPVENQGGPGTADGHWRESIFDNEIMTGYVNLGANPLSAVSIAAMADIGYQVDYAAADPYVIAAPFRTGRVAALHLQRDVAPGPIRVIPPRPRPARRP